MYSIKELYKIGTGPSSSHTMGPGKAAEEFLRRYPDVNKVKVILYGSLALTGKGHLTDYIIEKTILPRKCIIEFNIDDEPAHPNTLEFFGYKDKELVGHMVVHSVGGGAIKILGEADRELDKLYTLENLNQIIRYVKDNDLTLPEYIDEIEEDDFDEYMEKIYDVMFDCVDRGLKNDGVLPGKLEVKRKANRIFTEVSSDKDPYDLLRKRTMAFAYAAAEENASGGLIVTAPTCGAAGVLPACLRYAIELDIYEHHEIIEGLKVAGLIGNIVKENGSISGAEAGCQAEVGTACSMAAAFLAYLDTKDVDIVERAAEIALEHHLGLTCDPIDGYVQIPCIERNAVAALRAIDAAKLASYIGNATSKISFDMVVDTMLATGKDLHVSYRETSEGGLAKKYR